MKLFQKKRFYFVFLLPLGWFISFLGNKFPWAVEQFYSTSIFSFLSRTFGRFWAIFPFSVAEFIILALIVGIIVILVRFIMGLVKEKETRRIRCTNFVATLACVIGCFAFLFVCIVGLNYARPGFATINNITVKPSSKEELTALCQELIDDVNRYSKQVATKDGIMVHSASSYYELSRRAGSSFEYVGESYPSLGGYTPPTKPVLLSKAMSFGEITGVYFPFTFEANVNVHHPDFAIPFTMMHELAHLKGFMQENEANFIAYLACMESQEPDFLYSGSLMAFMYAGSALSRVDTALYWEMRGTLDDVAINDLVNNHDYWTQFETPIATISTAINDSYLKANNQTDGVKSYGQVVDLLLALFQKQGKI